MLPADPAGGLPDIVANILIWCGEPKNWPILVALAGVVANTIFNFVNFRGGRKNRRNDFASNEFTRNVGSQLEACVGSFEAAKTSLRAVRLEPAFVPDVAIRERLLDGLQLKLNSAVEDLTEMLERADNLFPRKAGNSWISYIDLADPILEGLDRLRSAPAGDAAEIDAAIVAVKAQIEVLCQEIQKELSRRSAQLLGVKSPFERTAGERPKAFVKKVRAKLEFLEAGFF